MEKTADLLIGFYGDDFTGSTDALEALTRAGLRSVLFLGPPAAERLEQYRGLRAVGIAGCSRSLSPEQMEPELGGAFAALKRLNPPIVHYKVCSTFDSSPQIGSIGRAIDIGASVFGTRAVPLVVGAPVLGRYCVFGNLFARSGLDSEPYRLDRHPTMSRHPITPMTESDLRVHLGRQTQRRIGLLDILALTDARRAAAGFDQLAGRGAQVVVIDILSGDQEPVVGSVICGQVRDGSTLFVAGSSGVEYAITAFWKQQGLLMEAAAIPAAARAENVLVMSGSCSPVTDRQIGRAVDSGAGEVALRTAELADPATAGAEIEAAVRRVLKLKAAGRTVICHTARGPADPRRKEAEDRFASMGLEAREHSGRVLGEALGTILIETFKRSRFARTVIAGGDTSFFTARRLGIEALEMIAPLAPGSPLCRASISDASLSGLEVCFKGGQVGRDDFFDRVLDPGG